MFKNYLKIAYLVFARRKFFTFVNLFGITFTLAILLVAASILDHIFGGQPPEVNQGNTLGVYRVTLMTEDHDGGLGGVGSGLAGYELLDRYMRDLPGAQKVSISSVFWKATSFVADQRIESFLKYTDAEFWEILEFGFVEGRPFTRDEVANADYVAVINQATKDRFFQKESAIGKTIEVNGRNYRVIGVVDNVPLLRLIPFSDIWVPLTTEKDFGQSKRLMGWHMGLILAESKSHFPMIREEFRSRLDAIDWSMYEPYASISCVPETVFDSVARLAFSLGKSEQDESGRMLRWLVFLAVLFMVLPTLNLVNLNVSRIMERSSEIGVRKAFGASSVVLVGQFLVENVILTLLGGVMAVGLTYIILGFITHMGWIPYAQFYLNLRIFLYAMAMALFFGFFSGVYPAWRMSRMNPVTALRGGKR